MKTTAQLECEIARLLRELVEVRRENVKLLLLSSSYQRALEKAQVSIPSPAEGTNVDRRRN